MPHFRPRAARRALTLTAFLGIAFPVFIAQPSGAQQRNGGNGNHGGNNGVVRGNGNGTAGAGGTATGTGGSTALGGGGTGGGAGSGGGGTGGGAGSGGSADDGASCMPGPGPAECQDRCPTFDTCTVLTSSGDIDHLYFRSDDQRFQCSGLDCESAAQSLNDYCCERGEFAPSKGGGGCTLPGGGSAALPGESGTATSHALLAVSAVLLAGTLIGRRRIRQK